MIPIEIKHLKYSIFKKEAKQYIVDNKARFLNIGNKDKIGPRDLPKLVPYIHPKDRKKPAPKAAKSQTAKGSRTKSNRKNP